MQQTVALILSVVMGLVATLSGAVLVARARAHLRRERRDRRAHALLSAGVWGEGERAEAVRLLAGEGLEAITRVLLMQELASREPTPEIVDLLYAAVRDDEWTGSPLYWLLLGPRLDRVTLAPPIVERLMAEIERQMRDEGERKAALGGEWLRVLAPRAPEIPEVMWPALAVAAERWGREPGWGAAVELRLRLPASPPDPETVRALVAVHDRQGRGDQMAALIGAALECGIAPWGRRECLPWLASESRALRLVAMRLAAHAPAPARGEGTPCDG